jgi:tryptophan halogenase
MSRSPLNSVAILGGGVAGWMTAGALARVLPAACAIRVVETADVRAARSPVHPARPARLPRPARPGRGRPDARRARDLQAGRALQRLDRTRTDQDHVEGFSDAGANLDGVAFHHHWLRARERGEAGRYEDYSLAAVAGRLGRFAPPSEDPRSVLSTLSYGLHLDAAGYVAALRSTAGRVETRAGEIADVALGRTAGSRPWSWPTASGSSPTCSSTPRRTAG